MHPTPENHSPIKWPHFAVLMLLLGALLASIEVLFADALELTDQRKAELVHLLKHDCGSCHGMTLQGGLGPALTVDAINQRPREYLELTILEGRAGTPMPPWNSILSTEEVSWLVDRLMTGVQP